MFEFFAVVTGAFLGGVASAAASGTARQHGSKGSGEGCLGCCGVGFCYYDSGVPLKDVGVWGCRSWAERCGGIEWVLPLLPAFHRAAHVVSAIDAAAVAADSSTQLHPTPPHARHGLCCAFAQTLLLSLTRKRFEEALGPLSQLTAEHSAWQQWLAGQPGQLSRNSPGPKFAELLAVSGCPGGGGAATA